ncbi:hypothetical protein Mapa_003131 [Marchantia paleacea]|nr:hypothetical protein Mapa_003131 [Marchantia paleacea]
MARISTSSKVEAKECEVVDQRTAFKGMGLQTTEQNKVTAVQIGSPVVEIHLLEKKFVQDKIGKLIFA